MLKRHNNKSISIWDDVAVEKLLKTYRKLPALWDSASPDYKCKQKKCHAMGVLSEMFNTTPEEVRRKIHNLRCTFNFHLRRLKMMSSETVLDRESVLNECSWKFFDDMKFLLPITTTPELSLGEEESMGENDEIILQLSAPEEYNTEKYSKPKKRTKRKRSDEDNDHKMNYQESHFVDVNSEEFVIPKNLSDERHDIFGKYVACELKNLSPRYAKKLKLLISKAIIKINEEEDKEKEDEMKEHLKEDG